MVKEKTKKVKKVNPKKAKILEERKAIEERIDAKILERKATKDKTTKKAIKKEIKSLRAEWKEIGKKDTYLGDVKKEMKLVRWPSRNEVIKYSLASFLFILFFALFFYGIDALFALVKDLIN